jgi:hypothetical protein
MPNYQNGKIYKLVSFQTDKIYIGSTCQSLAVRKSEHVRRYKYFLAGVPNYTTSYELIKLGDVDIVLIENFPCNSKEELHKGERFHIENTDNCVNKSIPTRSKKEYYEEHKEELMKKNKEYYENHKDEIKEYKKEWAEDNKDKIKEYKKEWALANKDKTKAGAKKYKQKLFTCSCGATITQGSKSRHEKRQVHLNSLK